MKKPAVLRVALMGQRLGWYAALILAVLLTSGCALRAPLVTPGQTVWVVWDFTDGGAVIGEAFTVVELMRGDWFLGRNPGDPKLWPVNLGRALQFTEIPDQPHPAISLDDGIRERVSR